MKLYYDLHIHSALSPCGDNDNTPNNIVNMSVIKGLDIIAVTDHNSIKNCRAVKKVADKLGLMVVFGMELTTSEEIHVLCLFENLSDAENFFAVVEERRMRIKNKTNIFGEQQILDENDEIVGYEDDLLILSSGIDVYEAVNLVKKFNGVSVLAHIDRNSYSVMSVLGRIPDDLNVTAIELSKNAPKDYLENNGISKDRYVVLRNSDAHYLGDISEQENCFDVSERTVEAVLGIISGKK